MWKAAAIAVSIVAVAGLSPAQDLIFTDGFEWGSICAWGNLWYPDADGDGWGALGTAGISVSCPPPVGYAPNQGDCDDISPFINPGEPELCDFIDNDCDLNTDDGIGESWFGNPCDGGDTDLCDEGAFQCSVAVQVCSDESDDNREMCNTIDDDCNPVTTDGIDEPWYEDPCDGADGDLCDEGISTCVGGTRWCDDDTGDIPDICDGIDNDCDPASADGSEDPLNGTACDGTDSDLCDEGTNSCSGGALVCSDTTDSDLDVCDGIDNDCDPASADGSEDPLNGTACDGTDSDLCDEGTNSCSGGALICSDTTDSDLDVCDGADNDCDPASPDGSEDPFNGTACDGNDSDLCDEGTNSCSGGALVCSDTTDSDLDVCDGADNDCDPASADGSEDPFNGTACDGTDSDLCNEGTNSCSGGALVCSDTTDSDLDVCDGADNDCDPASADGSEDPFNGTACDTGFPGVCSSGTRHCITGSLTCEQDASPTAEVCDGLDNDCDGVEDDGDPGGGAACHTGLQGVCAEGTTTCVSGSLQCIQNVEASEEICNDFVDNDCNGEVDCDDGACIFDPWCEPGK